MILAKQQRFAMCGCVVLTDEQPEWIHGELAYECGKDVDKEVEVDDAITFADKRPEFRRRNAERLRKCLERVGRLARENRAKSLDDGFDESVIDRLRQGSAPRW